MRIVMAKALKKILVMMTTASFLLASLLSPVFAGVISTEELLQANSMEQQRNELVTFMAREDVGAKLKTLGVSDANLAQRINQLSDAEVMQMHSSIDSMPAGEGLLGTVISLLVIFMLLDIAGVTDIFPSI